VRQFSERARTVLASRYVGYDWNEIAWILRTSVAARLNSFWREIRNLRSTPPGGLRAGFAQFTAFSQDAKDNKLFEQTMLTMPVLAVGGEKSFGPFQAVIMRHVATNVQEAVVPGSGHWLMEESPAYTVGLVRRFLDGPQPATATAAPKRRRRTTPYSSRIQVSTTGQSGNREFRRWRN
jgi:pimeloyl-ACP methyl ester carboxylesterase